MDSKAFGEYQEIPYDLLILDYFYQRVIKPAALAKYLKNFNESLVGVLKVAKRKNGSFAVLDGQHRLAALKTKGYKKMPCLVYPEMPLDEEAKMFHELNQNVNKLNSLEDFWSLIASGDADSIKILETVKKNGLEVAKKSGEREGQRHSISAIGIVRQIVRNYKLEVLDKTLDFVTKVWPANGEALTGQLLEGVAIFIKRHASNPVYNAKNAQKKLAGLTLTVVIAKSRTQAKAFDTRTPYVIVDLLCEAYNKGLSKDKKLTWVSVNNDKEVL